MNCNTARQLIMERLDGELPAPASRELDDHLAGCEACRIEMARQQRLIDSIRALPRLRAPDGFAEAVTAAIGAENRRASRWARWMRRYGAMAASIAVFIIVGVMWVKTQTRDSRQGCSLCEAPPKSPPAPLMAYDRKQPETDSAHFGTAERNATDALRAGTAPALPDEEPAAPASKAQAAGTALAKPAALPKPRRTAEALAQRVYKFGPADELAEAPAPAKPPREKSRSLAQRGMMAGTARTLAAAARAEVVVETPDVNASVEELVELLGRHYEKITTDRRPDAVLVRAWAASVKDDKQAESKLEDAPADVRDQVIAELRASGKFSLRLSVQPRADSLAEEMQEGFSRPDAKEARRENADTDRLKQESAAAAEPLITILVVPTPVPGAAKPNPAAAVLEARPLPAEEPRD